MRSIKKCLLCFCLLFIVNQDLTNLDDSKTTAVDGGVSSFVSQLFKNLENYSLNFLNLPHTAFFTK